MTNTNRRPSAIQSLSFCANPGESGAAACPRVADCRTLPLWQGLDKVIADYLDSVTVADLMLRDTDGNDYVI